MKTRTDKILGALLIALVAAYIVYLATRNDSAPTDHTSPYVETGDTASPVISTLEPVDSCYPFIFSAAFAPGTFVQQSGHSFLFRTLNLGNLLIESGRIIASDDVTLFDAIAFTEQFPVGQFPVELAVAKINNYERVAFARIRFNDDSIVRWEFALQPGQDSIGITDSLSYCYPVDAITGLFVDSVANARFSQTGQSGWNDAFLSERAINSNTGYLYSFSGHNMAIFTTGYGDGCYSTYIGYNSKGNPCCLLTDFGLIRWWKQ